jgi:hypothetical protein
MPTYILVQWHPKGTTKASETRLLLYHGTQAQELHERGVDTPPVAQWALNAVDWTELEPPDNDRCPYMAQRAAVSAISETYTTYRIRQYRAMTGIKEGGPSARPRAGCLERPRLLALGAQMASGAMARGARIGANHKM